MIKRIILLCIVGLCCTVYLCAQEDTILLRINGEETPVRMFESAYKKYCSQHPDSEIRVNDYLPLFIDDRLKIAEARAMRLDTTPELRLRIKEYNDALQFSYLDEWGLQDKPIYNDFHEAQPLDERFLISQIYKYIPQNCSTTDLERNRQMMQRLHSELLTGSADFNRYVEEYSEDKRCVEYGRMELSPELEQLVFTMRKGELSAPFLSSRGLHIVKIVDVRDGISSDEQRKIARNRTKRKYVNGADVSFLQALKDSYNYTPYDNHIKELLTTGSTRKTLFTLNGNSYTGEDFSRFAEVNPKGLQRQLDDFITKSLMDCEVGRLEATRPSDELSLKEYEDDLLLSEINRIEVDDKVRTDQAGLNAYFSVHKKAYRWERPRFRGVVLRTHDKSILREAKKLVKKVPFEEWEKLLKSYFTIDGVQYAEVEQGIYKEGDNAHVDERVFKKGKATSDYPFTTVIGKKIKGPEEYKEALPNLLVDYENFLQEQWLKRLYKRYSVEINEEVLKTVNNH